MADTRCRSCRAPVMWVRMKKSRKNNPLDPAPAANGNIRIIGPSPEDGKIEAEHARPFPGGNTSANEPRYVSHFSTCPQREQHRRPDQPAGGFQSAAPRAVEPERWKTAHCPGCGDRFANILPGSRCGRCFDSSTSLVDLREGEP